MFTSETYNCIINEVDKYIQTKEERLMLMKREEYEERLAERAPLLNKRQRKLNLMRDNLVEHKITPGQLQEVLNKPKERLPLLNKEELYLIGKQMWLHLDSEDDKEKVDPGFAFTEQERQKGDNYQKFKDSSSVYPIVINNVIPMGENVWLTVPDTDELKKWIDQQVTNYRFEIQREADIVIVDGKKEKRIKRYQQNIDEMVEKLLSGELVLNSQIILNAQIGTAEEGLDEVEYSPKFNRLTINKGTKLNIVDGYHRLEALSLALELKPDLEFKFAVLIQNFEDERVMMGQREITKQAQITEARNYALDVESHANQIIKYLNIKSELKDKVSEGEQVRPAKQEYVSFKTLTLAIDKSFEIENRYHGTKISKYLEEFFNAVIGSNDKLFKEGWKTGAGNSLMNYPSMFAGYIGLASNMMKNEIEPIEVVDILEKIDFSRNNPLWSEMGIVGEDGKLKVKNLTKVEEKLMNYFKELDLGKVSVS